MRLNPSKPTVPSITATKATVPGTGSGPASPVKGSRRRTRPCRLASGAMRANSSNRIAKPSPRALQVSRPKTAMPKRAT